MADTQNTKQPSFSTENDHVNDYRQLSRLAVCSLPLGLLSALSLISPLLWFVPLIAVVIALGGLWRISRANELTGRWLALFGLGLAILFGTWAMTWTVSRRMVLNHQARKHATEWLVLMQKGNYMKAHQLGMSYFERLPPSSSLEEFYLQGAGTAIDGDEETDENDGGAPKMMEKSQSAFEELESFKEYGVTGILVDAEGDFEFKFVKNKTLHRAGQFNTMVNQVFHVTFPDDHEPQEMEIRIELKRTIDNHKAYWQVGQTSDENEAS